jgi:hypothetical protein
MLILTISHKHMRLLEEATRRLGVSKAGVPLVAKAALEACLEDLDNYQQVLSGRIKLGDCTCGQELAKKSGILERRRGAK